MKWFFLCNRNEILFSQRCKKKPLNFHHRVGIYRFYLFGTTSDKINVCRIVHVLTVCVRMLTEANESHVAMLPIACGSDARQFHASIKEEAKYMAGKSLSIMKHRDKRYGNTGDLHRAQIHCKPDNSFPRAIARKAIHNKSDIPITFSTQQRDYALPNSFSRRLSHGTAMGTGAKMRREKNLIWLAVPWNIPSSTAMNRA